MLPPDTFAGDVVFVTGGGTGLGKAMATEFARAGADIVIASRSEEHRTAGIAAIEALGRRAIGVACDVRDPDNIAAAFDEAEQALRPISVLINNAAGNFPVAAETLSPNGWRAVMDIVANGTFFCASEFARRRMALQKGGAILNIGAAYAWTGGPGTSPSAAAKAAVHNLTRTLAVEWAPDNIRVNTLVPGLFPHDDMPAHMRTRGASIDRARTVPAGRVGLPHELGWAATYLCSPYAAYITGEAFVIDGANWHRRSLRTEPFEPVRNWTPKRS